MFNLRDKLTRARESLLAPLARVFQRSTLTATDVEELEALLLSADVGVEATTRAVDALKAASKSNSNTDPRELLRAQFVTALRKPAVRIVDARPRAILVVGINGVGKTTSIGKLAFHLRSSGQRVIVAACDTFRAAASDQLAVWTERASVELIRHHEGTDPAAVAHDACEAARARGADVVIVDTAGRLHTRVNLMDELAKVRRVCEKVLGPGSVETLLVLDANLGQNSLVQAQEFTRRLETDGVILTKLDGSARGGVAIAVVETLAVPIRYIGVGEGIDDLAEFSPESFVEALLG